MFSKNSVTLLKSAIKIRNEPDFNKNYVIIGGCIGVGTSTMICYNGSNNREQFFKAWLIATPYFGICGFTYGVIAKIPVVRELLYGTTAGLLMLNYLF